MTRAVLALLLIISPAMADAPKNPGPWVIFPTQPPAPTPEPPVTPAPQPDTVPTLSQDEIYAIEAKEAAFILASPTGMVSIASESGPVKVRGKFVGGSGKYETKTFQGPTVFVIEAVATGRVELFVIKAGAKTEADVVRRSIDVLVGPRPPPVPPTPTPIPAPGGLRVLFVYDPVIGLPPPQDDIKNSTVLRDYLSKHCAKGVDGKTPEWRFFPTNEDMTNESATWKAIMARPRQSLPWLVIGNSAGGWEGPWPKDVQSTLELLRQYGGN